MCHARPAGVAGAAAAAARSVSSSHRRWFLGAFNVDRPHVLRWLDAHDAAWRAADADTIAALFSPDGVYHLGPFDETWRGLAGPFRGADAIAAGWLAGGIAGERFEIDSEILAIDGPRAVIRRRITYLDVTGGVSGRWDTCWVVDFGPDGRCSEYREWYVEGPADPG